MPLVRLLDSGRGTRSQASNEKRCRIRRVLQQSLLLRPNGPGVRDVDSVIRDPLAFRAAIAAARAIPHNPLYKTTTSVWSETALARHQRKTESGYSPCDRVPRQLPDSASGDT